MELLGVRRLATIPKLTDAKAMILESALNSSQKKLLCCLSGSLDSYEQAEALLEVSRKVKVV
jgi:hypothetical protein